ncbi:hypothetical protein ED352_02760 [Muribaculaceae bacterium Isolate-002 (NCI)]|nr:hypothetical protein ED352_02760 [Muribaculaceae bacterium Isolate-002 (NCI)]
MDLSFSDLNFNSVVIDNVAMLPSIETLPGYEARAAFTVNSASVFKEDVGIVPTIVDDTLSYIPWGGDNLQLIDRMGDNQMPFDLLALIFSSSKNSAIASITSVASISTNRNIERSDCLALKKVDS